MRVPIKAIEKSGPLEVASRLQQRMTAIMRYAVQNGLTDYNPAQEMAGNVATAKRQHRPALELSRTPELLHRIDTCTGRLLTRLPIEMTLLVFICVSPVGRRSVSRRQYGRYWQIANPWKVLNILTVGQRCVLRTWCLYFARHLQSLRK